MRTITGLTTVLLSLLALGSAVAGTATALDGDKARLSYSAGYQAVNKLKFQSKDVDLAALLRGALDALADTPQLDWKEMQALLKGLDQTQPAHGVRDELSPIREGQAFLAANAARPGIKTLPSGLQYRVIQMGTGIKPRLTDSVVVHYRGSKVDGQEVDSSYDENRPEVYRVDEVMPGWTEALQLMPEGSEWELYIPSSLAYGKRGPLENQALIYHIKLLSVIADKAAAPDAQPAAIQE